MLGELPPEGAIELPGDHWVVLRDPMEVTVAEAEDIQRRWNQAGRGMSKTGKRLTDAQMVKAHSWSRMVLAEMIVKWDFQPEPTAESLLAIPKPAFNAIDKKTSPLIDIILGRETLDDEPEDEDGEED